MDESTLKANKIFGITGSRNDSGKHLFSTLVVSRATQNASVSRNLW